MGTKPQQEQQLKQGPEPDLVRRLRTFEGLYAQSVIDGAAKDAYIGQLLELVPDPPEVVTALQPSDAAEPNQEKRKNKT